MNQKEKESLQSKKKVIYFKYGSFKLIICYNIYLKIQTIFLLLILFIIEWAPYTAYYVWPILDENVPIRLNAIAPLAAKLSVVLTPWVLLNTIDDKSVKLKEK